MPTEILYLVDEEDVEILFHPGHNRTNQARLLDELGETVRIPIHYYDLDQACDEDSEQDFLVRATSDAPTLIVVEPSVFDDSRLGPFEILVRRCNLFQLVENLKASNADWRVLWQVPVAGSVDRSACMPTLGNLGEPEVTTGADVILFAHRQAEAVALTDAEVIVAKNRFGSLATVPLRYDAPLSSWSERASI